MVGTCHVLLEGKGGWCIGPTALPPACADCLVILGASPYWSPKDLSRPVMGKLLKDTCHAL